jgi:hypothetical protein
MNNYSQESHEMVFEQAVGQDTDELFCPVCGRRILVQWSPDFKKIVLEAGDEYAIHTASKGSPNMMPGDFYAQEEAVTAEDAERLAEWEVLLESINFESLWI